ncbi:MAG TPA: translocation/assembly module TamB domain-containing protein [Terracidiphilus sp.]|nr:translocation/assembly module TamB domain-containing protein [Terracidiphilus sp.]
MTEPASTLSAPAQPPRPPRRRLRLFLLLAACVAFIAIAVPIAFLMWAGSDAAEDLVRKRIVTVLEESTGGRVEIATFHWHPLNLQADMGGLVLHGREAAGEAPCAQVEHVSLRLSLLGFFSPRILLRDLEISHPAFHLIVYPDGSTNLPQPRKPRKTNKPMLDTMFDLQAGHVSFQQGVLNFENRASEFDFQNRFALLDLDACDLSLLIRYVPPSDKDPETYRIETGATDLSLQRAKEKPAIGFMQATLDLTRNAVYLRSLRITSKFPDAKNPREEPHAVELSGVLENFAQPHWQARTTGELDMRLLEPVFGYPFAPQGVAHLDLDSAGEGGEFRTDGSIHIDNGSYIGPGVIATGLRVDAQVHADPRQLLITKVVARLRQGGQLEGEVNIAPWLPHNSSATVIERGGMNSIRSTGPPQPRRRPLPNPDVITIPVNGKVTAEFQNVSLDALMDMVGQAPFLRFGLDTRLNGEAHANWVKGDQQTLVVSTALNLNPSQLSVSGEVPAAGSIDATYTQKDGAVDLRKLDVHTPASQIDATGRLGAYPLTSPSGLTVDFHSSNLGEFDAVLRDLGLNRNGKSGANALPVALNGEGDFHGSWTGSLVDPHIAGTARATQLGIEMVLGGMVESAAKGLQQTGSQQPTPSLPTQPQLVHWDLVEATGSYAAERIVIQRARLLRGKAEIDVDGTLDAAESPTSGQGPEFNSNSTLHAHLRASKADLTDLLTLAGRKLPLTGALDAQLQANGALNALDGSGTVELDDATAYGEPITRLRLQGTLDGEQFRFSSISVGAPSGNVSASGSLDLKSHRFQIEAKGAGIDIAKIETLRRQDSEASGTLGFSVTGSGTLDDPRLDAHATLAGLAIGGEPLGALVFAGHTANRSATYDATTRLEGAQVDLNGETSLSGDYATNAKLTFSHFNIGGLLKAANVQGLTGESALAGTITVEGPLAHPIEFRGDASLQQLAVSVAGLHLASQGGVHATLANGRVTLDPLHITGEDTDLRAQGSLMLKDKQQLDFAASGSVNLKLAETIDPDLTAGGTTTFQVEAHGTLKDPGLRGRIDFQDGALSLEDVPNGLSQLHGTLEFNQNRLEVKSLTAMSGGGLLSVGGYLAYQHGIYADLSVTGKGVRIRYPQGVSSLADTALHLQGAQNSLQLSGNVLITRFSVSPDLDIATLASQANTVQTIAPPDAPSNHIRLDVRLTSSPQLNFQNAYAKLAGNVDLRLRGTVASPSLLGNVSITEGSATVAGTRYDLQRGEISFTNPVRIEPTIDLNATARVEDYDITLGLHGTPQKLAVTYRSDPPLPEADVVALLALGRTENQQRLYTQQQEQSVANPTTDALLGGALNATVSSRVQKLFGAGSVKVDPNYIGVLGNSTSRITVEEQLGRNITLTFATDVDTTGQQLLQAEIAINRHVSLVVARDESDVFSMVLKATRRYR